MTQTVGMVSSYSGLDQADWLWKQTPHAFGVWGQIQMQAQAAQPDLLLLYQFDFHRVLNPPRSSWPKRLLKRTAAPARQLPPQLTQLPLERTVFLLREPPLPEVVSENRQNYAHAQAYCGYVSGPDDDAPQPDYMPAIWYVNQSFQELNESPPPEKLRSCSWITSGINRTANHRQRLNFLRDLQASGLPVDVYGRGLPDWVRSGGSLQNKWSGMAPYYYNLAVENYADNAWYVSEKLWDALLSWCLPIYYGGPAADALLPPGSFLRLPSLDAQGIAYIQEVMASPDAWYAAKAAIAEARQVILHKLNLLNWLSDYVGKLT
ncbi:MAG TPA: glycosyltransferase family 10 [Trichocoleus sp.]